MNMWRQGQLNCGSFEAYVDSVKWQSRTLGMHFKGGDVSDDSSEGFELLSPEDMVTPHL